MSAADATRCLLDSETPHSLGNMHHQACEACFRNKSKCQFDRTQGFCSRCSRLGRACRLRSRKRMGRRATAKNFAHGSTGVFDLDSSSGSGKHGQKQPTPKTIDIDNLRYDNAELVHGIKCLDSILEDTSPDTVGPLGPWWIENRIDVTAAGLSYLNPFSNVNSQRQVRWMLEDRDCFYAHHRYFLLGRSFTVGYQSAVLRLLRRSPMILTTAYCTVFELMKGDWTRTPIEQSKDVDLDKGASCLRDLFKASASIKHELDAAVVVVLGQILIAYNLLISWPCTHLIAKNTLLAARVWYPSLNRRPELDCIILTSIFVDTVECLVSREIPVVQYSSNGREPPVDRFIGLCSSLLPLLYHLCERSHTVKSKHSSSSIAEPGTDWYADIERQIGAWAPLLSVHFYAEYSWSEVTRMLCQARVYRTAALLVIHRLRYPLGTQDPIGKYYAEIILRELLVMKEWDPAEPSGFGVNFPLLVASLELPDLADEVVKVIEPLAFDGGHSHKILEFVRYIKMERERGFSGLWFELAEHGMGLHGVALP